MGGRIKITWAGQQYSYDYITDHIGGTEISYVVSYAKGAFTIVRHIQKDTFRQELRPGEPKLPQDFINMVGVQILIDQRPKRT